MLQGEAIQCQKKRTSDQARPALRGAARRGGDLEDDLPQARRYCGGGRGSRGGLAPHTVRAVISRLGSRARIKISRTQVPGRGTVYRAR
jgi:hypothetical protein